MADIDEITRRAKEKADLRFATWKARILAMQDRLAPLIGQDVSLILSRKADKYSPKRLVLTVRGRLTIATSPLGLASTSVIQEYTIAAAGGSGATFYAENVRKLVNTARCVVPRCRIIVHENLPPITQIQSQWKSAGCQPNPVRSRSCPKPSANSR
jgi:hypothetical protein